MCFYFRFFYETSNKLNDMALILIKCSCWDFPAGDGVFSLVRNTSIGLHIFMRAQRASLVIYNHLVAISKIYYITYHNFWSCTIYITTNSLKILLTTSCKMIGDVKLNGIVWWVCHWCLVWRGILSLFDLTL